MKCLCWDNDNQERSNAVEFEASDELEAAEWFAERHFEEEPFDSIDVQVEHVMDAATCVIRVEVAMVPVFTAAGKP